MEYSRLIRERYSVRKFSDLPVDESAVEAILEAARVAPTAVNKQPWRILVVRDAQGMAKLKDCTAYTFGAPMALVLCCAADEAWIRPYDGYNAGIIDTAIVGTQIMLAVHDLGLGSTWVGYFDPAAIRGLFNIPDSLEPVTIFPIGHPAPEAKPSHQHEKRRPLEDSVVYDMF